MNTVFHNARVATLATDALDYGLIDDADLAVWDVEHPAELSHRVGFNSLHERLLGTQP